MHVSRNSSGDRSRSDARDAGVRAFWRTYNDWPRDLAAVTQELDALTARVKEIEGWQRAAHTVIDELVAAWQREHGDAG